MATPNGTKCANTNRPTSTGRRLSCSPALPSTAPEVFTLPMNQVARALEVDQSRGFMKAVVDRATDLILGFAALGIDGGELMAIVEVAMLGGLTASALRDTIFAHPTLAESLNNLFSL